MLRVILKISSKWFKVLNLYPEAIKLLKKNMGSTLQEIRTGKYFLEKTEKAQAVKDKINK